MTSIGSDLKLYLPQHNEVKLPEKKDAATIKMISLITSHTTPEEFDNVWKENPDYQLENVGPPDPICKGGTSIHMAISKNNLGLGRYLIKKLDPKYINSTIHGLGLLHTIVLGRYATHDTRNDDNLELIRQLAVSRANVNLPYPLVRDDGFNVSPLSLALEISDVKLTKTLLHFGAEEYWAFTPDKKCLIKQKFTEAENKIYELAKKEIRDSAALFIFASKGENSSLGLLPKDIVAHILTCDRVVGSNHHRVKDAQRQMISEVVNGLISAFSSLPIKNKAYGS